MANAELAVTILGAQTGFQNLVTQSDPVSQINNIGQLAAGLASLVGNPQAILASNTAAAMVTLGKMDLDVRNGKYPAIMEILTLRSYINGYFKIKDTNDG